MKFTTTGSLGNIGRPLTKKLIQEGHQVTVISSNAERRAEIETLGANAAIGSINDTDFLKSAFEGADAIFTMTPPNMGGSNVIENTTLAGKALAQAIRGSGVSRVVMLSSIGADLPGGNGPIAGLYNIEQLFKAIDNVSITFLRAGYFYNNFYNDVPLIKGAGIMGGNFSINTPLQLAHPLDIATAVAEELQKQSDQKNVRYIISDVRTPGDVVKVIGAEINKHYLPWVEFTDEQAVQGMIQAGLSQEIAGLYTEMGIGLRNGTIARDFLNTNAPITGKIKLEDFAKEFSSTF